MSGIYFWYRTAPPYHGQLVQKTYGVSLIYQKLCYLQIYIYIIKKVFSQHFTFLLKIYAEVAEKLIIELSIEVLIFTSAPSST